MKLKKDSLTFTYCQVPVVYHVSDRKEIRVHLSDGNTQQIPGLNLGPEYSVELFNRSGLIDHIEVCLSPGL